MNVLKKTLAAVLALVLMLSLAGCSSKDMSWAATYDNQQIATGVYLAYLLNGFYQAETKVEDPNSAVLKQEIEGQPAAQWIEAEALKGFKKYVVIEKQFRELGLSFTEEEQTYVNKYFKQEWDTNSGVYEKNGISQESMRKVVENSFKRSILFTRIYGKDGTKAVPEEEKLEYFRENYARSNYLVLPKKDDAGQELDDAEKEVRQLMLDEYKTRIENGESFEDILLEYEKNQAEDPSTVHSHDTPGMHDTIVPKTGGSFPAEYVTQIFALTELNKPITFEDDTYFYLAQRIELLPDYDQDAMDDYEDAIITALRTDEFNEYLDEEAEALTGVTLNEDVFKKYVAKTIKAD